MRELRHIVIMQLAGVPVISQRAEENIRFLALPPVLLHGEAGREKPF